MKPIRINFFASALYRRVWLGFSFLAVSQLAVFGWQLHQIKQQKQILAEQAKQLQLKRSQVEAIKPLVTEPQYSPAFSKQASQAAQLLKIDWNKAFSTLENLKIPGVRLQTLSINTAQNYIEAEFEFAQLSNVSEISEDLAAGYNKPPWQLISTNAISRGLPQAAKAGAAFMGRWQAKLDEL